MQIGEPLRTIVVEPVELPVQEPETQPEPANEQRFQECYLSSDSARWR
jgi:hypothetical protein